GLLHRPEPFDEVPGRHQLDALLSGGLETGQLADAELGVLEAHPAVHPADDLGHELPLGLWALPLGRDLLLRPLGVAGVREEAQLVAAEQAGAGRPGEAGQVADVGQVGDEELVELLLADQTREPVAPGHTPSLSAITCSASW